MNGKTKHNSDTYMYFHNSIANIHADGIANVLTTDNGSEFRNKLNAAMLKKLGIRHSFITPYHPQSNGLDERYNQTLQSMLSKAVMEHKEMWDEFIDSAVFAYNTSTHESTTYSPFEVMFGRKARLPVEADLRPIPSNYDSRLAHAPNTSNQMAQVAKERQEILKDVKRNILAAQAKQKQHMMQHTRAKLFDVGVQSVHTQSLRSFLTPSLESVLIPTFQSAFAHSLQSVYATAFQSTSAHSLQSVYTTAFQSVYTTAFQSVYTTSVYTTAFQSLCTSYKAAEDDEEFDETSLRLKEGEYALSKDITVCLWLEYRSLNDSTPLRDVSGGDFVIVNEELHGEFDEFRSKVYAYVDKEYSIVEAVELLQVWCRASKQNSNCVPGSKSDCAIWWLHYIALTCCCNNPKQDDLKYFMEVDLPYPQSPQEVELWQLFWSTINETNRPSTILLSLQACSKVQLPNIYTILHIMAVWPLTTCEAERSFSGLRRLKNYMRSTMKEYRLNGLALMMVHRTISVSVENIIDTVARHP
eukprot:Em0004g1323a